MTTEGLPIKAAARRTGLSAHVIRIWEKRYGAVSPQRTSTNRRLYTEEDVERLILLRKATLGGRNIGQVAQLSTEKLFELVSADGTTLLHPIKSTRKNGDSSPVQAHYESCLSAIERLDVEALEAALRRGAIDLSQPVLIDHVIAPIMQKLGELWREGSLKVVHEHLASATVRTFLGNLRWNFEIPDTAPNIVVTTPAGQQHELGALIAAATASSEGWRVTYLGPNLPAEEIAKAVQESGAKAVALSLIHPADDPRVDEELRRLRRCLAEDTVLLVGGRAAESYAATIDAIGAERLQDMLSFRAKLENIRSR